MSALLTTTMPAMQRNLAAWSETGCRAGFKVMGQRSHRRQPKSGTLAERTR
jgi:methanogenic corrinoid protein MtbC1